MKQIITVNVKYPNGLFDFQISGVYLDSKNTLVVVAETHLSNNMNDAVRTVSDSVTVETGFANELPYKVYFINNTGKKMPSSSMKPNYSEVSAIDKIPEIKGLQPLDFDRPSQSDTFALSESPTSSASSSVAQQTPELFQNSACFWRGGLLHFRVLDLSDEIQEIKDKEVKRNSP